MILMNESIFVHLFWSPRDMSLCVFCPLYLVQTAVGTISRCIYLSDTSSICISLCSWSAWRDLYYSFYFDTINDYYYFRNIQWKKMARTHYLFNSCPGGNNILANDRFINYQDYPIDSPSHGITLSNGR